VQIGEHLYRPIGVQSHVFSHRTVLINITSQVQVIVVEPEKLPFIENVIPSISNPTVPPPEPVTVAETVPQLPSRLTSREVSETL